ncbi:T9SS type A sorting domain-containing protein [Winogradskyella eckloniae]|uniref:T9SS type A sorting domain-containing protein n=1 Tax=Winogradskyella eckloniae TaxID=1089306 RepID=UPI001563E624|nr:T9SS type A sorting domain-containing protein [Winogradskyella eckloniae]NRD19204.1 T9SS type A sorting domain-containing protein [Winogradskyella eckloniae]
MKTLYTFRNQLFIFALALCGFSTQAQNDPFNCDYNAYLFQYNDVYAIDLASGNSYQVAADVTPGSINAAAYNPADGFIWGSLSTPAKSIVRIGNDFTTTTYYIDELPNSNRYVGDVSADGIYYLKGGGTTYYKIDLNPESVNYTQFQSTGTLSQNLSIHDWAFNAVDGNIYAVEKNTNILYRINPENGVVTALGEVPILSGLNYTYGAVYFDNEGRFYVSSNQTGTIYVIQAVQTVSTAADIESNLFAFGPSSASNDGARCPTAPVLQEICDNGIDDDGDGLIDCEDPSCSGFGSCEVIAAPTSSSNNGGLESNNRLAEQINARNFKRAKTGYKFDPTTAPKAVKRSNYATKSANSNFTLEDFIPLTTINEDEAVEASPSDLIGITNATEIYAVDYIKNNSPIASVLALKTENGVYEHTKYICDRLLGGELVNVSTMDINEQQFIKSIIKNEDGTFEFVLSLSAKVVNNDANFAIESHWNLDQYEANVTFYNFQIWSNSIDDLYALGQELLNLLEVEKPITSYNISTPPTVFVKSGGYSDGGLDLQIVNTNGTQSITLDAGYRTTETEPFQNLNYTINLNGNYITNLRVETGNLFDIGFRIGDGIATPDDLFMSDGPWGIDDSQTGTNVSLYEVSTNSNTFAAEDYPIERNVTLNATTDTYVAAYRALTPRFQAVDVSEYTSFQFSAQGTGDLEITFVKESVTNWEEQFKAIVSLTDQLQAYTLQIEDLENNAFDTAELNDVVTIVFTMVAENGTMTSKSLNISDLRFSAPEALSIDDYSKDLETLTVFPNPMSSKATINFAVDQSETVRFEMYNQLGKRVYSTIYTTIPGNNSIEINRERLSSGLYFCKIISNHYNFTPVKLIIK